MNWKHMSEPGFSGNKEVSIGIGVFVDEINLTEETYSELRQKLRKALNSKRERMSQLDPICLMAVQGGDSDKLRETNAAMLRAASEAAMFRLMHDDPHSEVAQFMKESNTGLTPIMIREVEIHEDAEGKSGLYRAVAICLNEGSGKHLTSKINNLKGDFVAELGLVLTKQNQRNLYPRNWEGKQAMTLSTIPKG